MGKPQRLPARQTEAPRRYVSCVAGRVLQKIPETSRNCQWVRLNERKSSPEKIFFGLTKLYQSCLSAVLGLVGIQTWDRYCYCCQGVANTCVCVCVASRTKHRQVGPSDHKTGQDGMYNSAKHNTSNPSSWSVLIGKDLLCPVFLFCRAYETWCYLTHSFVYRIGCLLPSPGCSLHQGMYFPLFLPLETMPSIFRRHIYVLSEQMQIRRASTRWEGRTDSPWSQGTQISRVLHLQK